MPPPSFCAFLLLLGLLPAACGKGPESYTRGAPEESLAHAPPAAASAISPPSSGTSNGTGAAVPARSKE